MVKEQIHTMPQNIGNGDGTSLTEKRLWQAVIVSTIREWISGPLRLKRQAEEYLFNDNKDFPVVCQSAGMDVGLLRAKLTRLALSTAHDHWPNGRSNGYSGSL
jgi:hypothetical protein